MKIIKNPKGMEGLVRIIDDTGAICTVRPDFVGGVEYNHQCDNTILYTPGSNSGIFLSDMSGDKNDELCRLLLLDEDEEDTVISGRIDYAAARAAAETPT